MIGSVYMSNRQQKLPRRTVLILAFDGVQIIDIAGPARASNDDGYLVKGGTGFAVRTLVELVDRFKKPARSGSKD